MTRDDMIRMPFHILNMFKILRYRYTAQVTSLAVSLTKPCGGKCPTSITQNPRFLRNWRFFHSIFTYHWDFRYILSTGVNMTANIIFSSFLHVLVINKPTTVLILTNYLAIVSVKFLFRVEVFFLLRRCNLK